MKREQFQITSTAGHNVIKFKWNSACREIERLAGEMANNDSSTYQLTNNESVKDGRYHVAGFREWTRDDGFIVKFNIQKLS